MICDTSPLPAETTVFRVLGPVDGSGIKLRGPKSKSRARQPNPLLQQVLDEAQTSAAQAP